MDPPVSTSTSCSYRGCKYAEPALLLATFSVGIVDANPDEAHNIIVPPCEYVTPLDGTLPFQYNEERVDSETATLYINVVEMQYCGYFLNIREEAVCLDPKAPHFTKVQQYTTTFQAITMTFRSILPGIIMTFMGPWSDLHGRRPLMMLGATGSFLTIILLIWATYAELNPIFLMMFDAPLAFSGGGPLIILGIFCHVCDQTTVKERAFRLGILQCFNYIGTIVGTLGAPYLRSVSYTFALFISGCISLILNVYIYVFLKESLTEKGISYAVALLVSGCVALVLNIYIFIFLKESLTERTQEESINKNPFQWSHLQSLYKTCFDKQSSTNVKIFVSAGLLIFILSIDYSGEASVLYLYLQKEFSWTIEVWTRLQIIRTMVSALLSCTLTSKILGLEDLHVIPLVIGIRIISAVTLFLSRDPWTIYTACIFGRISGVNRASLRSYISKKFAPNEIGKVYALCSLLECFGPFVGSFIYSAIYRKTLEWNLSPNLIFLVSIFLCLTMVIQTTIIAYFNKRHL